MSYRIVLALCALSAPAAGAATCDLEVDGDASYTCGEVEVEVLVDDVALGVNDITSEMGLIEGDDEALGVNDITSEMGLIEGEEIVLGVNDITSEMGFIGTWSVDEDGAVMMEIDGDGGVHELVVDGSGVAVVDGEVVPVDEVADVLFGEEMAAGLDGVSELLSGALTGDAGAEMLDILDDAAE